MPSPHVLFSEMPTPTPTPTVEDSLYNQSMENVIYEAMRAAARPSRWEGMVMPSIPRRHGVRMPMASSLSMKTLWRATMVTRGMKMMTSIAKAFQSLEAFKARHNDKPFTLTHCWRIINNFPKFKDQYRKLQRKRGNKTSALAGGGDGEALKRPMGKTNSKMDDKSDAASFALHETLHNMMSQNEARDEKKRQGKEEQMKQYLELQTKKFEMEKATKKRNIDMEEASPQRQLDIEATNASTKVKEVALATISVDLSKMSKNMRSWFEVRQKEMLDTDDVN
ncbi:Serine/threonine-protein kinase mph1 [Hordeum vulgare]|nr:Serine/threonine-protein kinase mph1 [Hordeum vulgare]